MKSLKLTITKLIAAGAALTTGVATAAGPLFLHDAEQPLKWDTSNGPIPVYTDGGPLDLNGEPTFAFDFDGVTAFVTVERADEITQFAFDEWNNVSTSTFEAQIAGSIEDVTGINDVTGANATQIYDQENGYGFFVNYDTDSTILSDYFGVGPSVLGIAFPEIADSATGEILEATAVINANQIWEGDTNGDQLAGVFTHEFGHAINLSHSQVNGDVFYAPAYANRQSGPRNCGPFPAPTTFEEIETMFPFLSVHQEGPGAAQSTVNLTDDKVAISNLYPAAGYPASLGTISGVLRLKDGATEYSGINVIARNVNNWYGDAVSAMTGDQTQGLVGPDGRFTINGLTPGEDYVLYIENIWAGGYPTRPQPIVSQAEYWNAAESNDPSVDDICEYTPITAEAGVSKTADIVFNGYNDGVQYTPVVSAFLTDLSKNGRKSSGFGGSTAFVWDVNHEFSIMPEGVKANNGQMTRNGQQMLVQYDFDGNGIQQAALARFQGQSGGFTLTSIGDFNGDTCGGASSNGVNSTSGFALDDSGHTVVGLAYVDQDGDGVCQRAFADEIIPFVWTAGQRGGIRELDRSLDNTPQFVRAHAISGDGSVILGAAGRNQAVAWVNEGPIIDLRDQFGVREVYATNHDGTRVALSTPEGIKLWNAHTGGTEDIGELRWCDNVPFVHFFFGDLCARGFTHEDIAPNFGPVPFIGLDMNDEGSVLIGRAGTFFTGFDGGIWVEGMGWLTTSEFLTKQGVTEALDFPMDNPISIDAQGDTLVGGLAGASVSWLVEMSQVFVCDDGADVSTSFPEETVAAVAGGAEFGRCAFID